MEIKIVKGDITNFKGDAIVSISNTRLKAEGGLSGAIFKKAGYEQLQQDCNKLAPVDVGNAVITKGYNLKAKYIIHTPGPIYSKIANPEKYLVRSYYNSLLVAKDNNINTIAFPSISTFNGTGWINYFTLCFIWNLSILCFI